jgi:tetratricopeptide (TPR) repeat protein
MKTRPLAFALLLSLAPAAALPPRVAFAQAAADETTTKMARQRFQEGVAFYDKGQFEMARAAFLQAYALRKHPTVLMNLAQSSLKSGHSLEAARYFQQFLKEYSSSATEAQRADATHGLGEARMKLGRIDVLGATVGADIFVDDERIGMAPLDHSVDVEPGTHTVRTQGANGEQTISVTASAGQGATAKFGAVSAAPVPPPPAAPAAEPPAEPAPAPPFEPNPAPAPPPAALPPEAPTSEVSHHWGWVVGSGVVMVAGFTLAAVMGAEKASAQNSANGVAAAITNNVLATPNQPPYGNPAGVCSNTAASSPYSGPCANLATDNNNVNADATVANVGIAIGVIGAVGLIASIIVAASSYGGDSKGPATTTSSLALTPILGRTLSGMSLGGSF